MRGRRAGKDSRRQHRLADDGDLRPETKDARRADRAVRLLNRVDLPPGRYQLRVAAHDAAAATLGSVLYDLEVPDFAKLPFVDERPGADVARRRAADADGPARRRSCSRCCPVRPSPRAASRRTTRSRSSPRSTTTTRQAAQGRHHDDGDDRRGQGGVQDRGGARLVRAAGAARRLRLRGAGAAEGSAARVYVLTVERDRGSATCRPPSARCSSRSPLRARCLHDEARHAGRSCLRRLLQATPPPGACVRTVGKGPMSAIDDAASGRRSGPPRSGARSGRSTASTAPLPAVDFSREMVVGVFLGTPPDGRLRGRDRQGALADSGALVVEYRRDQRRHATRSPRRC